MKIRFTMKTPDVVDLIVKEAREDFWADKPESEEDEFSEQEDEMISSLETGLNRFFQYGEVLKLEYDTETEEMKVVPR